MEIKALILDRDGTLIEHVPYLHKPEDVSLLPGVREALKLALDQGIDLFIHSNQSGVGRGMFELADVDLCNRRMIELLDLGPDLFKRICIAPESPYDPPRYRKPSVLFVTEVMEEFDLKPAEIAYVGDRGSDLATAHAAGTCGVGVATGLDDLRAELALLGISDCFPIFDTFPEAIEHLLNDDECR